MNDVTHMKVGSQDVQLIVGYRALRTAARDWQTFSSSTPFRVPIPEESALRDVRQYPIETDPPDHRSYRHLIDDRFSRAAAERIRPELATVIDSSFNQLRSTGSISVVEDLAIPVVTTAIAATIGRPGDAERLRSWGVHVFTDPRTGRRQRNRDVDAYLEECVTTARVAPGDDLFGDLAKAELSGRPLSVDEMLGFGSLVLAGGRDTVIAAITGALWHLATHPDHLDRLGQDPSLVPVAIEEYLRYFSPLPFIGRTATRSHQLGGCPIEQGSLVGLGFAGANHDPRVFNQPETVALDRRPNRHVAFGHGPHTCIGAALTRMQIAAVVERLIDAASASQEIGSSAVWSDRPADGDRSVDWIPAELQLSCR